MMAPEDFDRMEAAAIDHVRSFFARARKRGLEANVVISAEAGITREVREGWVHTSLDGSRRLTLTLDWPAKPEPG